MQDERLVLTVIILVGLLLLASISAVIAHRIRFPYTIGLVVVGLLVSFLGDAMPDAAQALESFKLQPVMIMFVFIPILIFQSAYSMDARLLLRNLGPVLTLAGPGLLVSTGLIGAGIWALTSMPFEAALVFGCLISATDPVGVIALFQEVGAPKRLTILMEGESVLNDATAIVTFQILLAVAAAGLFDMQSLAAGVGTFFVVFVGGALVGLAIGWLMVQAIPLVGDQPLVHITLTLVAAYGAFILADHYLETSGVLAVLAAGLTIGYYAPSRTRRRVHEYLKMFWDDAAFVANSLIFLMLGLSERAFLDHAGSDPVGLMRPVLVAVAVVMLARFAVVFSLVPILNRLAGQAPIDRAYQMVLAWGGVRGAIAIALAISLPEAFPHRGMIIDFTFGVTLFTLLVNGTTMRGVMARLGLLTPTPAEVYLAAYGRLEAARAARDRVAAASAQAMASPAVRQNVMAQIMTRLAAAEAAFDGARQALGADQVARHALLWTRCFAVDNKVWRRREHEGILATGTAQRLSDLLNTQDPKPRVAPLVLPCDRQGLLSLARRVLPGKLRAARAAQIRVEEAAAIIAGADAVMRDLPKLSQATGAAPGDVAACHGHYAARRAAAVAIYEAACARHADARQWIETRLLRQHILDAERVRLAELRLHGALPTDVSDRLQSELEDDAGSLPEFGHVISLSRDDPEN